ncbi:MAG: SDR family NAD(P)-dependent oxidoreductase [Alphaproteobacteria bacterium]|nr:SDR family NAD(P)-dependent oxidoreductase [Alphaproteobacteria bacterium]MBP7758098.1 SDR family NAD(P)-dependent oxidoreductase [Alphaproteobacteria bacterium]MBP7761469.1 SDR family NAD(P)-dependent oxidoreductase [Alphaproteobacteria bacterium]MBP7905844.1 SDR family NAD(P)-dependent oxidoreductase [Alphaproteobacteria bacterium]
MSYESRYSFLPSVVFISGSTGDFGWAFAERFAALGSKLILAGRDVQKLESLKEAVLGQDKIAVHLCAFDMTDKKGMEAAINTLPEGFRDIDLLINNAGLALGLDPAPTCDLSDWETMIAVNNTALVQMTRLILPGMAARKRGHIINIGSTAGTYPYPGGNVYCATKAFVKQFSLSLRADLKGTNIRVTNIEPGMVETQFSVVRFKGDAEKARKVYDNTENLHAEDVAEAVVWSATLPPKFNVNRIELMPTTQTFGPLVVERFD